MPSFIRYTLYFMRILCYNKTMDKKSHANVNVSHNFASDVASELRKVTWPTRKETIRLTAIVIVISLIIGAYIGIIDILLAKALEVITKSR